MTGPADHPLARRNPLRHGLTAWGPGLLVMLADTDAGNVVAAAQAANALLFPLVVGLLIALTAKVLAPPLRLRGARHAVMIILAASVGLIGLIGAAAAFF
jgi:hypothetical protein